MAVTDVRNIRAVRLRELRLRALRLRAVRLDDRNKRSSVMLSVRNGTTVRFQEATTAARFSNVTGCLCPTQSRARSGTRLQPEVLAQSGISSANGNVVTIDRPL